MKVKDGKSFGDVGMFYEDGSPAIEHYGIKGMHWGVRNSETLARYSRNSSAKKARKTEAKNLASKRKAAKRSRSKMADINRQKVKTINDERKYANKNRALLSDAELDRRINRLRKEQQLNQLTQAELSPGRYAVKSTLTGVGKETLKSESKDLIKKGRSAIRGKN